MKATRAGERPREKQARGQGGKTKETKRGLWGGGGEDRTDEEQKLKEEKAEAAEKEVKRVLVDVDTKSGNEGGREWIGYNYKYLGQ